MDALKASAREVQGRRSVARDRRDSTTAAAVAGAAERATRMDRFIDTIEWLAAMFVGIVALNIFVAVRAAQVLQHSIPDTYDFGRMLLGILIFWGIAATSYRGGHITVDLVWTAAEPALKR